MSSINTRSVAAAAADAAVATNARVQCFTFDMIIGRFRLWCALQNTNVESKRRRLRHGHGLGQSTRWVGLR